MIDLPPVPKTIKVKPPVVTLHNSIWEPAIWVTKCPDCNATSWTLSGTGSPDEVLQHICVVNGLHMYRAGEYATELL